MVVFRYAQACAVMCLALVAAHSASADDPARQGWSYSEQKDEMRGTKETFAQEESTNELTFGFPYKGGSATFMLRQRTTDGLSVLVEINGMFVCNSYSGDHVAVKFDTGKIEQFRCSEPANGGSGVLFINEEKRFVSALLRSKRVIIEAQFYDSGPGQMIFNAADLHWPPDAAALKTEQKGKYAPPAPP